MSKLLFTHGMARMLGFLTPLPTADPQESQNHRNILMLLVNLIGQCMTNYPHYKKIAGQLTASMQCRVACLFAPSSQNPPNIGAH